MGNQQTSCSGGGGTAASAPSATPPGAGGNSPGAVNDSGKQSDKAPTVISRSGQKKKNKPPREKNRYGTVIVKVTSLSNNRRVQDRQNTFVITPRGGLFHGTQCNPLVVQKGV